MISNTPPGTWSTEGTGQHRPRPARRDYAVRQSFSGALCHTHTPHTHTHTAWVCCLELSRGSNRKWGHGEACTQEGLAASCSVSVHPPPPFLWCSSILRTRKGTKFWVERLITDSAGELSFRRIQFRLPPICIPVFSLLLSPSRYSFRPPPPHTHLGRAWFKKWLKGKPVLLLSIPNQTLWGSWAQNPFCDPHFLITGDRLHSASITFPEFQRAGSNSCY